MEIFSAIFLGIVQALTEFLPVSSSGHLALAQQYIHSWTGGKEVPLTFDIMVHFATLIVTTIYVRADIFKIIKGVFSGCRWSRQLVAAIIVASIPAGIVGVLLKEYFEAAFHSLVVVAFGFLLTSIFLEGAQRLKPSSSSGNGLADESAWQVPNLLQALLIGMAQAVSITPGVSRSGSTICSALMLGLDSKSAVHFSFLMSLPVIFGATMLESKALLMLPASDLPAYLAAFLVTILTGWLAIRFLVIIVRSSNLRPFALYTLLLGCACLIKSAF